MFSNKLLDLIEVILAWIGKLPLVPIAILFSVIGLCVGLFLIINPTLAIEIQKKVYEKIGWRIEPISIQKEIRNTRSIGWLLIVFLIVILVFIFVNRAIFF